MKDIMNYTNEELGIDLQGKGFDHEDISDGYIVSPPPIKAPDIHLTHRQRAGYFGK